MTKSKTITLPEIGEVLLRKNRQNKHLRLSFDHSGLVKVSLPIYATFSMGIKFIEKNQKWILDNRPEQTAVIKNLDRIGKTHTIYFRYNENATKPSVRVTTTKILITLNQAILVTDDKAQDLAIKGAERALAKEAKQLLPIRINTLAEKHDFSFNNIKIRKLSSRWGSCDLNQNITLNYFLMQIPWDLIDYVLLHELVHTKYMNHSVEFWNNFLQKDKEAKNKRKRLKKYKTIITPTAPGRL